MSKVHKIKLEKNEAYTITDKRDTILIFTDSPDEGTKGKFNVTIILPDKKIMDEMEVSNSINIATAIAIKFKSDPTFAPDLLQWLADYIQSQVAADDLIALN